MADVQTKQIYKFSAETSLPLVYWVVSVACGVRMVQKKLAQQWMVDRPYWTLGWQLVERQPASVSPMNISC